MNPSIVMHSPSVSSVFIAGIRRPMIFIPSNERDRELVTYDVFIHELAHIKRHDTFWNFTCQLIRVLFPIQPLLPLLTRELRKASDFACDDYVMKYGHDRYDYAYHLYNMVRIYHKAVFDPRHTVGFFSDIEPLVDRIRRIVDTNFHPYLEIKSFTSLSVTVLFGFLVLGSGSITVAYGSHTDSIITPPRTVEPIVYTTTETIDKEHLSIAPSSSTVIPATPQQTELKAADIMFNHEITAPDMSSRTSFHAEGDMAPTIAEPSLSAFAITTEETEGENTSIDENVTVFDSLGVSRLTNQAVLNEPYQEKLTADSDVILMDIDTSFEQEPEVYHAGYHVSPAMYNNTETGEFVFNPIVTLDRNFQTAYPIDVASRDVLFSNMKDKQLDPIWSPDGGLIAFTDSEYGIWTVPIEGGKPFLIFNNYNRVIYNGFKMHKLGSMDTFCFTSDGKSILFQYFLIDDKRGSIISRSYDYAKNTYTYSINHLVPIIVKVSLETGEISTVMEEAMMGCFSNDNRYLAYLYYDYHQYTEPVHDNNMRDLTIYDTKTGIRRFLTNDEYRVKTFCFTRDNACIIASMVTPDDDQTAALYRIPVTGGSIEKLPVIPVSGHHDDLHCTVDGEWIVYSNTNGEEKYFGRYNLITGKEYITTLPESVNKSSMSPDGTAICCVFDESTDTPSYKLYTSKLTAMTSKPAENQMTIAPFSLTGNFPNPFNSSTSIEFNLDTPGNVSFNIYTMTGQKVCSLLSESMSAGRHSVRWDGCDDDGRTVSTGVYIGRLVSGRHMATHKMTVMK